MTPTQIKKILNDIELRPSKKLGQNFLTDGNILDIIMKAVKVSAKDEVLEIGPGTGALTAELLKTGAHITAVEYDHRLADYLKAEYQGNNKLKIIQGDACKMGWNELFLNHEFKCFGNLPYAISSIFISSLLEMENPPVEAVFMLQKEMADRLVASCNTKEYSSLSVRLQKFYDIEVVKKVSPNVFYPKPEVDSIILKMTRKEHLPSMDLRTKLKQITKVAFSQRRKKALKMMSKKWDKKILGKIFSDLDLSENLRAEQINIEDFFKIAEIIA